MIFNKILSGTFFLLYQLQQSIRLQSTNKVWVHLQEELYGTRLMLLLSLGFMVIIWYFLWTQFGLEKKCLISESQVTYGYMDDFTCMLSICFYKCLKEKILLKWKSRFSALHGVFQHIQSDSAAELQNESNLPNSPRAQLCSQMLFCKMIKMLLRKNSVNYLGKLDHICQSILLVAGSVLAFVISFIVFQVVLILLYILNFLLISFSWCKWS